MSELSELPKLGVAICAFNSRDVLGDCLDSLMAAHGVALDVVVADNASSDGTVDWLKAWALERGIDLETGSGALHRLRLIETGVNGGFAAGVNAALRVLQSNPDLDRFWVLNPDCSVPPETPRAFATHPGEFALMGGRVLYADGSERIQIDGGTVNTWTGVTGNVNLGAKHAETPAPDIDRLDFITGASMVASRAFLDQAGSMPEDYFLYYEEVDWALRRGSLPLAYCPAGVVYHRAGTAIGSPTLGRAASTFSLYFKHRGRMRFMRRYYPGALPVAFAYSLAKAAQLALKGQFAGAVTIIGASLNRPPSAAIRSRLSPAAQRRAF